MSAYEADFNIRYTEIDSNNKLSPIAVMQYLQEIGCLHSDSVDMGLNQNTGWVIIHWKVKILQSLKWNEKLHIRTWISGVQGPYCVREYKLTSRNKVIAVATSRWVLTDSNTHKIMRITEDMVKKFGIIEEHIIEEPFGKLKEPENYFATKNMVVTKREIDTNHHVNNIKYIELAYNMLEDDDNINYIEVMYKHASVLGDNITLCYNKENEKISNVLIKNEDKLSCIVKFGKE